MRGRRREKVDLRILGPLEVRRDDEEVKVPGRKARTLLACLIVHGGNPVSRDRLIDAIWGDKPPKSAVNTMHTYVTHLRAALDDSGGASHIATHPNGYAIDLPEDAVDAWRLQHAVADARRAVDRREFTDAIALLDRALGEWRGPPLEEFRDCGFAVQEAARLEDLRVLGEQLRADAHLETGDQARAVELLEPLVNEYPYRENLWEKLMLGLHRTGRQTDALAAYSRLSEHLAEIGLEPGDALVDLETRILERDPTLLEVRRSEAGPRIAPAPVPKASDAFVGRASDLDALAALADDNRLITLTGIGGVGKSRLALAAVQSWDSEGRYVDLAAVPDGDTAVTRIAEAFGLTERTLPGLSNWISDASGSERLTLIVDNAEHLTTEIGPMLSDLVTRSESLNIVITSREPLDVPGEATYAVGPLPVDTQYPSEAERLFLKRSRFDPDHDADRDAIRSICRVVNGIPAAVEVAAGGSRVLSLPELAENLDTLLREDVGRQSLPRVLDWSYQAMNPSQQELFQVAALFVDGFTFDALLDVTTPDGNKVQVLDDLGALVERSLVAVERGTPTRYRMLDVFKDTGLGHLDRSSGKEEKRSRFVSYFLAMATGLEASFGTERWQPTLDRVDSDEANVTEALKLAISAGDVPDAYRIAGPMGRYWRWRGRALEGAQRLVEVARLQGATDEDAAKVQRELAAVHRMVGSFETSREHAAAALGLYDKVGDRAGRADALYDLALAEIFAGRFREAESLLDEAASIWKQLGKPSLSAFPMIPQAWLAMIHGEYGRAEAMWTAILTNVDTALFPEHSGTTFRVAELALVQGQFDRARQVAEEALDAAQRAQYPYHEAAARAVLARLHLESGDLEKCDAETELALHAATTSGNVEGVAQASQVRCLLALRRKDVPAALRAVRTWVVTAGHIGGALSIAALAGLGGRVQGTREEWGDAAVLFAAEAAMREEHGLPLSHPDRADTEIWIDQVRSNLGDDDFAEAGDKGRSMTGGQVLEMLAGWFD